MSAERLHHSVAAVQGNFRVTPLQMVLRVSKWHGVSPARLTVGVRDECGVCDVRAVVAQLHMSSLGLGSLVGTAGSCAPMLCIC
jgi:hypothetical protein